MTAPWVRTEYESDCRGRVVDMRVQVRDESWRFVVNVLRFGDLGGGGVDTIAEGIVATRQEAEAQAEAEARRWFEALPERGWWAP